MYKNILSRDTIKSVNFFSHILHNPIYSSTANKRAKEVVPTSKT